MNSIVIMTVLLISLKNTMNYLTYIGLRQNGIRYLVRPSKWIGGHGFQFAITHKFKSFSG